MRRIKETKERGDVSEEVKERRREDAAALLMRTEHKLVLPTTSGFRLSFSPPAFI